MSLLVRRGISSSIDDTAGIVEEAGRFPTFEVAESAPTFGTEEVRRALDEESASPPP